MPHRFLSKEKEIARFWSKIDNSAGSDECWPWMGLVNNGGYGYMYWREREGDFGKNKLSHRMAYVISGGSFTENRNLVLHSCHFRRCCNPSHLRAGNSFENIQDAKNAGRLKPRRGDQHGLRLNPHRVPRGERQGHAKLTDNVIRQIREIHSTDKLTLTQIGERFGVSGSCIHKIVKFKAWKHVV